MKKSFIVYHDAMDVLEVLDDSQVANLFRAMISLSKGEDIDITDPLLKAVFIPIKNQMSRDVEKYKTRAEANRNNGLSGGRPKNPTKPKKPTGFSDNPTKPKKADTVTDTVNDTDNVSVTDKDFEDFWQAFPKTRAGSKDKARQAYMSALKRERSEVINQAVKKYSESDEVKRGFAKGCAAWLNDDRWTVEYGKPISTAAQTSNRKYVNVL